MNQETFWKERIKHKYFRFDDGGAERVHDDCLGCLSFKIKKFSLGGICYKKYIVSVFVTTVSLTNVSMAIDPLQLPGELNTKFYFRQIPRQEDFYLLHSTVYRILSR